jgi:hypothetical protein
MCSSVLLKLITVLLPTTAYLLAYSLTLCPLLRNLLTYEDAARARLTENTSRDVMHSCVTSQRMLQLRGQKENVSCDLYLLLCDSPRTQRKHSFPIVARKYFGRGPEMTSFYSCMLEHVYGALAWQRVFLLQYFRHSE